ncbi:MAG TPA: RDD family protein [Candidatus Rifleibacterium sp.]|nr:RDD family protein [Candidatus Rifleibacterium sp.]HPT47395.1 RDD family protein [Candidatus Rifleibacterium sp.]
MLDTKALKDLLGNLSPDDKRECVEELSRLELSQKNAEDVYRILQILETGLDVNLAIQVRAVCRKLEAQFPGKFSFDFLTSEPVIEHLRNPAAAKTASTSDPVREKTLVNDGKTRLCPFCAAGIEKDAAQCRHCSSLLDNTLCKTCGRHSYQTKFCVWCDTLMNNASLRRPSVVRRALAFWLDYTLMAASALAFFHFPDASGLLFVVFFVAIQLYFMSASTTIGKSATGLMIVRTTDSSKAGFSQILFRETIAKMISLACLGIGFFWFLYDENGLTWHDLLSNSIVVQNGG